jgi:phosphatidylinositol 4-kinase
MSNLKREPESWLLRLFDSEYFDCKLAIFYLHKYPSSYGIQYYICEQIRKFPEREIIELLPQFCHLMISKPNESAMLENLLVDLCVGSSHMAILVSRID